MTSLRKIRERYEAAALVSASPVDLVEVGDSVGGALDSAIRDLTVSLRDDDPDLWVELLALARQLRFRVVTEPCGALGSAGWNELTHALTNAAHRQKQMTDSGTQVLLDALLTAVSQVDHGATPTAVALLEELKSTELSTCRVVAVSGRATAALQQWLTGLDIDVSVVRAGSRKELDVLAEEYLVGAPTMFAPSVISAPSATALSFFFPSWVAKNYRELPISPLSLNAEGGIRPRARLRSVGVHAPSAIPPSTSDELNLKPVWREPGTRHPIAGEDEVLARRVLLGGSLSMLLDNEGEFIRAFDPDRPPGERVEFRDVQTVLPGTYLVVREGETEVDALFTRTLELLGEHRHAVETAQHTWKDALRGKLEVLGRSGVVRGLEKAGVRAADRAPAWTSVTVARPKYTHDFELLLDWLGLPRQPHVDLATLFRRTRLQAVANIRDELEHALSIADMQQLDRDGFVRLEVTGFAGIVAARVLAVSPHDEIASRHDVRVPVHDARAQWLE